MKYLKVVFQIAAFMILFLFALNTNRIVTKIELQLEGKKPLNLDSLIRVSHNLTSK